MALNTRIQTRRDTAANWEAKNPVLLDGEMIIVTTNAGDIRFKIGDGTKTYKQLPFQDETLYNVLSAKADAAELEAIQAELDDKVNAQDVVPADWNQNDPTQSDYIKNRTHYEERSIVDVLAERQLAFENGQCSIDTALPFVVGETYIINWQGVEYNCVAVDATAFGASAVLGDIYTATNGGMGTEATGEPFFIMSSSNNGFTGFVSLDGSSEITISIKHDAIVVHKIDEKYLPESCNDNILNGNADYSVRTAGSAPETDSYAMGDYAFAEGYETTASAFASHAEGYRSIASGGHSHAEGNYTTASGDYSHADGNYTTASGESSHAEGHTTTASGTFSHAEGHETTASGESSHAEGYRTTASGTFSHAEGHKTTASGDYSHAEGNVTTASSECQHVQGKYNVEDAANKYAHIVGNGELFNPSNAHTLDWEGNAWFAGGLKVGGTGQDDTAAVDIVTALNAKADAAELDNKADVADLEQKSQVQIITWGDDD